MKKVKSTPNAFCASALITGTAWLAVFTMRVGEEYWARAGTEQSPIARMALSRVGILFPPQGDFGYSHADPTTEYKQQGGWFRYRCCIWNFGKSRVQKSIARRQHSDLRSHSVNRQARSRGKRVGSD